ncbi:MAG: hypothetical protein MNPFHGCM_02405 [Gemmatimonadaceae bacterium]|nr:hypothetical protein [Gemmatimonadaceae bacterium]
MLAVALVTTASRAAQAQSTDRRIERLAERIAAAAERTAERVSEAVERALRDYDRDSDAEGTGRLEERIDTTFAFPRDGAIDLSSVSGEIVVNGWSRGEIRIRAVTERGRFRTHFSSSRVSIEVESVRGRSGETSIEISAPEGIRLVMQSTSGELTARGTKGVVEASSVSGDVTVDDARGRVTLETVSGMLQAARIDGDVEATTVSGDLQLDAIEGPVRVETTSGEIRLADIRSDDVYASTVSGDIEYRGDVAGSGRYEFHAHSGDVTLDLPTSVSARFSIETYSGDLDSDFPVTLQPGERSNRRPRRFEFTIGGGAARVVAESFNGDIRIAQRGINR